MATRTMSYPHTIYAPRVRTQSGAANTLKRPQKWDTTNLEKTCKLARRNARTAKKGIIDPFVTPTKLAYADLDAMNLS